MWFPKQQQQDILRNANSHIPVLTDGQLREQDPEISPLSIAPAPTRGPPGVEKSSSAQGSHTVFSAGGGDPGHINTWGQFSKLPLSVISLRKEVEYLSTAGLGASPVFRSGGHSPVDLLRMRMADFSSFSSLFLPSLNDL